MSKLGASSKALVNLEKMVLSGSSFWEDEAEALFDQMSDESETDFENQIEKEIITDRFEERGH